MQLFSVQLLLPLQLVLCGVVTRIQLFVLMLRVTFLYFLETFVARWPFFFTLICGVCVTYGCETDMARDVWV